MRRSAQAVWILALALAGLGLWSALRPGLPRAGLAETPSQGNRIRLEAWMFDKPQPVVLAGTSLSARLLPEYFHDSPLPAVANLGLEGLSPDTSLALAQARTPPPGLILLEAHRLEKPVDHLDEEALESVRGAGIALTRAVPGLRADVRPSSMLYAWLKTRRPTRAGPAAARPKAADALALKPALDWEKRIGARVAALKAAHIMVALVRLPAGYEDPADPLAPTVADRLGPEWGVPVLDVNREARKRGIPMGFTDGLHLDGPSARSVARLLAELAAPLKQSVP